MTAEQELWTAVMARAIVDVLSPSQIADGAWARRSAVRFFEHGGSDFNLVCSLAGLDPDAVRAAYRMGRFNMGAHDLQGLFRSPSVRAEFKRQEARSA